jgi:hypothetical protein
MFSLYSILQKKIIFHFAKEGVINIQGHNMPRTKCLSSVSNGFHAFPCKRYVIPKISHLKISISHSWSIFMYMGMYGKGASCRFSVKSWYPVCFYHRCTPCSPLYLQGTLESIMFRTPRPHSSVTKTRSIVKWVKMCTEAEGRHFEYFLTALKVQGI